MIIKNYQNKKSNKNTELHYFVFKFNLYIIIYEISDNNIGNPPNKNKQLL